MFLRAFDIKDSTALRDVKKRLVLKSLILLCFFIVRLILQLKAYLNYLNSCQLKSFSLKKLYPLILELRALTFRIFFLHSSICSSFFPRKYYVSLCAYVTLLWKLIPHIKTPSFKNNAVQFTFEYHDCGVNTATENKCVASLAPVTLTSQFHGASSLIAIIQIISSGSIPGATVQSHTGPCGAPLSVGNCPFRNTAAARPSFINSRILSPNKPIGN